MHSEYLQNWAVFVTTAGANSDTGLTLRMGCAQPFLQRYEPQMALEMLVFGAGWMSTEQKDHGRKPPLMINMGTDITFIEEVLTQFFCCLISQPLLHFSSFKRTVNVMYKYEE